MGLPYTHSGVLASALAMDKERTKSLYRGEGLPVVESRLACKAEVAARHVMEPPYVVKPYNEGSSVGVYLVRDGANGPPALSEDMPEIVMVETYAPGRELTTTVLGDRALTVTDIVTDGWYDYDAKYKPGGSRHVVPAEIPQDIFDACLDYSERAHRMPRVSRHQPHRFPLGRDARARRPDPSRDEHSARHDADLAVARAGRERRDLFRPHVPAAGGGCLMQQVNHSDPAPSRLRYRMQRMMLTPVYRRLLRIGLPLAIVFGGGALWVSQPENLDRIKLTWSDLVAQVQERPEFMVKLMAVDGASDKVAERVRAQLAVDFPISSFDLNLDTMRKTVVDLPAVKSARLRIRQGGVLQVAVVERVPRMLWRSEAGLVLLDEEGVAVGPATDRAAHPDLAVMAGEGADKAVPEAIALIEAAQPIKARLRGLARRGERRWDVVLSRGQRIMLPETGAVRALERAIAMDDAVDLFARDLEAVDLRLPQRPTLRMTDNAAQDLRRIKKIEAGDQG